MAENIDGMITGLQTVRNTAMMFDDCNNSRDRLAMAVKSILYILLIWLLSEVFSKKDEES